MGCNHGHAWMIVWCGVVAWRGVARGGALRWCGAMEQHGVVVRCGCEWGGAVWCGVVVCGVVWGCGVVVRGGL